MRKRMKKRINMSMCDQMQRFGMVRLSKANTAAFVEAIRNPQPLSPEIMERFRRINRDVDTVRALESLKGTGKPA